MLNRAHLAWLLPVALGAGLRIHGLDWGLPDPFEESTPFYRAWGMWNWNDGSGLDFDPGFYRYPSLVFYVQWLFQAAYVAITWLRGGEDAVAWIPAGFVVDRGPMLHLARTVGAAFGIATVAGAFALGRALAGRAAGVVTAVTVATSALLIRQSQMIEVDTAAACFVTWGLWACTRVVRHGGWRPTLLAGAFLGLATSAKYPGAFLAVPLLVAHATRWRSARLDPDRAGPGLLPLAAAGGAALLAFALTSPFVLLNLREAWEAVGAERAHMQEGHFGLEEGLAYGYYARELGLRILGPPGVLAVLAGVVVAVRRRNEAVAPLGAFVLVMLAVVGSWSTHADRYLLPVVPALWALAAIAAREAWHWRRPVGAAVAVVLAVSSAWTLPEVLERTRTDTRTLARAWIEEKIPEGALILMEGWGPDLLEPDDLWTDLSYSARQLVLERATRRVYAVQFLPMYQTSPDLSEAFYDFSLLADVDLVVLSSDVGDRYRREPERFARQLAFYEGLERSFARVATFDEAAGPGPEIRIYLRPDRRSVFAQRPERVGPVPLPLGLRRPAEGEATWYQRLALNYESFGFLEEALRSYSLALVPPSVRPATAVRVGMGLARCHLMREDRASAVSALRQAAERCPGTTEAASLLRMAAEL